MDLEKIIREVSEAYDVDGAVLRFFQKRTDVGDGLAEFLVRELEDTYDEKATSPTQLEEARRAVSVAVTQLNDVLTRLGDVIAREAQNEKNSPGKEGPKT